MLRYNTSQEVKYHAPLLIMKIDSFEHLAARFVAASAQLLPDYLVSLVFASPLSARSPDLCMLWHPLYRKNHKIKIFAKLLVSVLLSFVNGLIRMTPNLKPFGFALYGNIRDTLLVLASVCGHETPDGGIETVYVPTKREDAIFVFGTPGQCGMNYQETAKLTLNEKLLIMYRIIKSGIKSFLAINGNLSDRILLLLKWLAWGVSLQWINDFYLEKALSGVIEKYRIKKIGCVHEMHFYSRIVWRVAYKYNATGYTLQHAAITHGKKWYFYCSEEIENGLKLPDVMFIYNKQVEEMLKPYYGKMKFIFGCSNRYAHWKDVKTNNSKGKYCLFAGALARFDNDVLFASIRNLLSANDSMLPIKLRLHPYAMIGSKDRRWLKTSVSNGLFEVSSNTSLRSDIENASVVIGMSTTVLEEAILLGRPVIQLSASDYLQYIDIEGIEGIIKKDYIELNHADLLNASLLRVDSEKMRERLGLIYPIVTYNILFYES